MTNQKSSNRRCSVNTIEIEREFQNVPYFLGRQMLIFGVNLPTESPNFVVIFLQNTRFPKADPPETK